MPLLALCGVAALFAGMMVRAPQQFGILLAVGSIGLVAVVLGLRDPLMAVMYLLGATFFRLAIPSGTFPVDPFLPAFGGVVMAVAIEVRHRQAPLPNLGLVGSSIGLYVVWNIGSLLTPHAYPATFPQSGEAIEVSRFVLVGVVIPLTSLILAAFAFHTRRAIRALLFALLAFAAYSALVSVLQFTGPASLVWPRYIVSEPDWVGRAVGVFNQPGVNGLVLVLGYLAGLLVASHATERRVVRVAAGVVSAGCCVGIYLTHTRAAWLSFVIVVALGIVLARGWRKGFILTAVGTVVAVASNWSTISSPDRDAGGVSSTSEVFDRLNMIATSFWAVGEKPLFGWGLGRFPAVNTYFHQQWSPSVPWNHGYGFVSHFDVLGIAVELGLIGVGLWLFMMGTIMNALVRAVRRLPQGGELHEHPFGIFAFLSFLVLLVTGLTVDMRFFDFPTIIVLLAVGAVIGRAERWRLGDQK